MTEYWKTKQYGEVYEPSNRPCRRSGDTLLEVRKEDE